MKKKERKHQFRDATKKVEGGNGMHVGEVVYAKTDLGIHNEVSESLDMQDKTETMQDNAPAMQDNGETMQDKAEEKKHAPKVVPEVTRVWDGMPSTYNPGMCPNCGSSRNVITKTDPADLSTRGGAIIHRLHVCKWCGTRFRSIQHINAVDVGHVAVEEPPRAEA